MDKILGPCKTFFRRSDIYERSYPRHRSNVRRYLDDDFKYLSCNELDFFTFATGNSPKISSTYRIDKAFELKDLPLPICGVEYAASCRDSS